ncbi:MAG: non-hydrolyzing UDP-N-acetylglucosamine 2-epimerase [Deltaproteobacteria bacterium]
MRLAMLVGARPNFMKIAPVMRAVSRRGFARQTLIHTGQHYDAKMSDVFFAELAMPAPDLFLGVGSGSQAEQTAAVLVACEKAFLAERPDVVVVAGDVNSTVACALAASKLEIPVAHVEAGLRSGDRRMPEELNRIVTDQLSEILYTPSADGDAHLLREGIPPSKIERVGNVMIDSLREHLPAARASGALGRLELRPKGYALLTLHRPSNVDDAAQLRSLLSAVAEVARELPVLFPVHPRTRKRLAEFGLTLPNGLRLQEPLGYLEFLALTDGAALVLTDSGGIQEETTALGVPCLTLRENTERPVTVEVGTNELVGLDPARIVARAREALHGHWKVGALPELWDGHAAERIAQSLEAFGRLHVRAG